MEKRYRILIAEDDVIISETLKDYLEELGHHVMGVISSLAEAKKYLDEQPDFVFLDIRMHGEDEGFKIANLINQNYVIPFLFLTSFSDKNMIRMAANYKPTTYLIKPFTQSDIYAALEIAIAKVDLERMDLIALEDGQKMYYINPKEVCFIQAEDKYLAIQYTYKRITIRGTLGSIKQRLPNNFVQCHRSYIVNTTYINSKSASLLTVDKFQIPISRSFKIEF